MKTIEWEKHSGTDGSEAETATFARGCIRITVKRSLSSESKKFYVRVNGQWHPIEFGTMEEAKDAGIALARASCRIGLAQLPTRVRKPQA